eukprot:40837-Hanusia_phi.AAC.3
MEEMFEKSEGAVWYKKEAERKMRKEGTEETGGGGRRRDRGGGKENDRNEQGGGNILSYPHDGWHQAPDVM